MFVIGSAGSPALEGRVSCTVPASVRAAEGADSGRSGRGPGLQAWTIVSKAYVDSEFGGHEWEGELSQALVAAFRAPTGDAAYKEIGRMLDKLGDPFTRIMPPACGPAARPSALRPQPACARVAARALWFKPKLRVDSYPGQGAL